MAWIDVGGIRTYYEVRNIEEIDHSEDVCLFIHGGGGSVRHWHPLFLETEMDMPIIALDLPGHGLTGGTICKTIPDVAAFIDRFLDALSVKRPVTYVGHSIGGLIGLQFALQFPANVNRLILLCTSAKIRLHPDFVKQALSGEWDLESLKGSFFPGVPEEKQSLVLNEYLRLRTDAASQDFSGVSQIDLQGELSRIPCPALVISANEDVIISPRHSRNLAKGLNCAKHVGIPNAGHYVQVEQPQSVAHEIHRFYHAVPEC
ncbi:alpha/beta fold hydrolase [Laceyella sacchari]|uniref:Alpha/beta hydrolase n=1 Tax=Laceyella sacchari TaxID=37482 RepID=A0ABY5U2R1_LACSH|nr:alpha/beta hydrolase [Laceyella sacchari]UWE03310.1 alpha/beta hydrolase [Laceyella sacchari]